MRFWLFAHPNHWKPDDCEPIVSLKCLHEDPGSDRLPVASSAEATCYRVTCCMPEPRAAPPSILRTNGDSHMEQIDGMELCGMVTVAPMDAASVPKAEAATPKPCVIRPVSEVISSCRKRKLSHVAEEMEQVPSPQKERKHKKKSKRKKAERIDAD